VNPYDANLQLNGFGSSLKKAVKKVGRQVSSSVKGAARTAIKVVEPVAHMATGNVGDALKSTEDLIKEGANRAEHYTKLATQPAREIYHAQRDETRRLLSRTSPGREVLRAQDKVEGEAKKLVRQPVFQLAVNAVATFYGVGTLAGAAFAALARYDAKLLANQKPSAEELQQVKDATRWMARLHPDDLETVLLDITPETRDIVRANIRNIHNTMSEAEWQNLQNIWARRDSNLDRALFDSGFEVSNDPEIRTVTESLLAQGMPLSQVQQLMGDSRVITESKKVVAEVALTETVGETVADLAPEEVKKVVAQSEEGPLKKALPVLAIASLVLL